MEIKLFENINIPGKRLEGEDFKTFRKRRKATNKAIKDYLKRGRYGIRVFKKGYSEEIPPLKKLKIKY